MIINSNQHLYRTFCKRIQSTAAYYYSIRKIITVISLHLRVLLLAKCTPYQYLDYNISHNQYLPDTFGVQVLANSGNTGMCHA